MAERIVSFVMSGGVGSRLWPLSREDNPKQFHDLSGDGSMLVKTLRRLTARPAGETPIFLIASEKHADRVHTDLAGDRAVRRRRDLRAARPQHRRGGRASQRCTRLTAIGDGLVLVVPSDHEISTERQFWETIETGAAAANDGRLVVFGIKPSQPETGFGYIEVGGAGEGTCSTCRASSRSRISQRRKTYLAAGNFYWNTGIFLFRASAMRDAFAGVQPRHLERHRGGDEGRDQRRSPASICPPISTPTCRRSRSTMRSWSGPAASPWCQAGFRWNDLGSWQSLLDISPSDDDGNVIVGDVVAIDCENSYLRSDGRLLSAIGMKNVAIVSTADATFVAPVSHSQNVKKIVEQLEKSGRLETKFTPAPDRVIASGAWRERVATGCSRRRCRCGRRWASTASMAASTRRCPSTAAPLKKPKRMRTMARQVYAFAVAKARGWDGPADELIAHGLDFMAGKGRTDRGGWVRTLNVDGSVADPAEDAYDHSCVLLALAEAHRVGHPGCA